MQAIFKITIANFNSFRLDLWRVYDKQFMDEMKSLHGLPVFHLFMLYRSTTCFNICIFPYNAYTEYSWVQKIAAEPLWLYFYSTTMIIYFMICKRRKLFLFMRFRI